MAYPDALQPGTQFGPYEIKDTLWSSSAGFTYRARNREQQRDIIIQEYLPAEVATRHWSGIHVMPLDSHNEAFERGLTHFLQQARVLAQIHDPYICRINEYTEANATAYLIMDYESGQTLKDYLEQRKSALNEDELNKILIPILKGLRVIHSSDLLHLDINPSNIFLRDVGPPVLVGFGSTHRADTESDLRLDSRVTPGYSPIELYHDSDALGPHTDLYALGATIYRCVTRVTPVDATKRVASIAQDEEDPLVPAMEMGLGDYSSKLLGSVDWMLQPKIADRPQSAGAVLGILAEAAAVHPRLAAKPKEDPAPTAAQAAATTTSAPPLHVEPRAPFFRPPAGRAKPRWLAAAGVAAAIAVLLLVLWPEPERADQRSMAAQMADAMDKLPAEPSAEDNADTLAAAQPPKLPKSIKFDRENDLQRAETYRRIEQHDKQVEELLATAKEKLADGRLVAPITGNALADYRAVLAIDPNNADARQGIGEIVDELVAAAGESRQQRDLDRAEDLLAAALDIEPDNPAAKRLQKEVLAAVQEDQQARDRAAETERQLALREQTEREQQQAQERARSEQIVSLLSQADEALRNNRYAEPPGSNALEAYRAILQLEPDNSEARAGIDKVASHFLQRANNALAQDQFEEAEGFLVAAAAIKPGNEAVSLLRSQLRARREIVTRERQQRAMLEEQLRRQQTQSQDNSNNDQANRTLNEGIAAYYSGDFTKAYRLLLPLAEDGNARAQFRVGIMYHLGRGVETSALIAQDWIRKALPRVQSAATSGVAWAQADLGALYEDGLVVAKNRSEALRWYRQAAKKGYPGAQTNLGVMYANGNGVEKNLDEAVKWFKLAAAQGDRAARDNLTILGVE